MFGVRARAIIKEHLDRVWDSSLGLAALPSLSIRLSLSILRLLPTLITISSSSIDSPVTHAWLTYPLPYT